MSPRADVVEGLKDARFSVHIVKELVDAVGWPLEAIVDVLNDEEEGPERLQRAYSFLESCPADIGRGERTQILENILRDKKGGPPETDDEGDEDEGEADNEGGDIEEDSNNGFDGGSSSQVMGSQDSVLDYEPIEGVEPKYDDSELMAPLEAATATEATEAAATEAAATEAAAEVATEAAMEAEATDAEATDAEATEAATEAATGAATVVADGEETDLVDEWGGEDDDESGEDEKDGEEETQSATDAGTDATQGGDGSDQEGMGRNGMGIEACGAAGLKRGAADAAPCTPLQPKRPRLEPSTSSTISPRHEPSTSSTISAASTVDNEGAAAEAPSMMEVVPPPVDVNSGGGNAVVVHNGAHMPVVPTGGSMVAAGADETPQADLAHLALRMDQMQQELRQEKQRRQVVERVVERLAYPEELVARANQALVAIGTPALQRKGTGFLISSQGYLFTDHHVLLDCNWDQHGSSLLDVGLGESIVWSLKAEVVGWTPTPRPHARGKPDHRSGKPKPWLDLALLKIVPAPSPPLPHLLPSSLPLEPGTRVAIVGYGSQQRGITEQGCTQGWVARLRRDPRYGCEVIDIQGDMLPGHSGGPVIDLRNGGVAAYCLGSQSEVLEGDLVISMPSGPRKGKFKVKNPCGGLHIAIPVSELNSLFGTRLTA